MPEIKSSKKARLDKLCQEYYTSSPENLSSIEAQITELAGRMDIDPQNFISNLRTNRNSHQDSYLINYFE
jgi:hypothetical protein